MPRTNTPAKAGTKTPRAMKKTERTPSQAIELSPESRHEMIKAAAYFRAEKRGFQGGDPISDWLLSEQEIDSALAAGAH